MKERRSIDGGSPAYWQELKEGYTLIGHYRQARLNAEGSPTHYGYNMNEDGEFGEIEDNLGRETRLTKRGKWLSDTGQHEPSSPPTNSDSGGVGVRQQQLPGRRRSQ